MGEDYPLNYIRVLHIKFKTLIRPQSTLNRYIGAKVKYRRNHLHFNIRNIPN